MSEIKNISKMSRHIWKEKEIDLLKRLYAETLTKDIAKRLGLSVYSVYGKACALGLKKSDEFKDKTNRELGSKMCNHPAMLKNRFRKGIQLPHQFMPPKGYHAPGVEKTWFKKGNLPVNTLYDGAITIRTDHKDRNNRQYKWIRIGKAKWKELQKFNWEKKYGKIPRGMVLRCKDGDTFNCKPSNWKLITKAMNCELNSGSITVNDNFIAASMARKDPQLKEEMLKRPEIIELKRSEIKLRRAIKNVA